MGRKPKKEPQEHKVHVEEEEQLLRCDLTPEEFNDFAGKLAAAVDTAVQTEDEAKAAKADLKARSDKAAAEVGRLGNIVRNKYEMRKVTCETHWDFTDGMVKTVRTDTGAIIDSRKMLPHERERQAQLFPVVTDEKDAKQQADEDPEAADGKTDAAG